MLKVCQQINNCGGFLEASFEKKKQFSNQNNIQPFDLFKCRLTDILSFRCIVRFPTRFPLLSFQIFFTSHYTKEYASLQFIDKSFSMQDFTLHQ